MKNLLVIMLLICSSSLFAISDESFKEKFNEIQTKQKIHIQECRTQNEKIFKSSFHELDKLKKKNENVELVLSKDGAINALSSYSPEKDFSNAYSDYYDLQINNCEESSLDSRLAMIGNADYCENAFDEMNFFRSLIFASSDQQWNKKEKQLLENAIMKTIETNLIKKDQPLIKYLTAFTVLEDLLNYNENYKKYSKKIREIRNVVEKLSQSLSDKNKALKYKKITCQLFKDRHQNEIDIRDLVKSKLVAFLKAIKH